MWYSHTKGLLYSNENVPQPQATTGMNLTSIALKKRRKTKKVACFYPNKVHILAKLNSTRDVLMDGKKL